MQTVNLIENDQPVNMPWPMACKIACYALIHNMTFDEVVVQALRTERAKEKK